MGVYIIFPVFGKNFETERKFSGFSKIGAPFALPSVDFGESKTDANVRRLSRKFGAFAAPAKKSTVVFISRKFVSKSFFD